MEPVSFDVVFFATTAISTMQLRCNTDCCARRKLLGARILCLLCFSSTVTLKLTSILCCFRQHPLHQTKVHRKLNWQWPVAPDQGVSNHLPFIYQASSSERTATKQTWEKIAHSPEEMFSIQFQFSFQLLLAFSVSMIHTLPVSICLFKLKP